MTDRLVTIPFIVKAKTEVIENIGDDKILKHSGGDLLCLGDLACQCEAAPEHKVMRTPTPNIGRYTKKDT